MENNLKSRFNKLKTKYASLRCKNKKTQKISSLRRMSLGIWRTISQEEIELIIRQGPIYMALGTF